MFSRTTIRSYSFLLYLGLILFSLNAPAHAGDEISKCDACCRTSCPGSCPYSQCAEAVGGTCVLIRNLVCDSSDPNMGLGPIELYNGKDLDMHGRDIDCGQSSCNDAIHMNNNGSRVFVGAGVTGESVISGPFSDAVDCGLKNNTQVIGITFLDAVRGIRDCAKVFDNVFGRQERLFLNANWGIQTSGVANTDEIANNYFYDRKKAIAITGDETINVHDNVFHTSDFTLHGIFVNHQDAAPTVSDNVFLGVGKGVTGTDPTLIEFASGDPNNSTLSNNLCDQDHADCDDCIASGWCTPFTSPFEWQP